MRNLAGVPMNVCSPVVLAELREAEVPVLPAEHGVVPGEVASPYVGQLTGFGSIFSFVRAWYYWIVSGPVPLPVAMELYDDPVGRREVRSGGDAACRTPELWVTYLDNNGRELVGSVQLAELEQLERSGSETLRSVAREMRERYGFSPNPAIESVQAIVNEYHIDSQEGLNLFVATLKKHSLVT